MKVVTVLKVGGEYNEGHVAWLRKQIPDHIPVECLTDSVMPDDHFEGFTGAKKIPLQYNAWGGRGWWAKMELFRPDLRGDFLYVDLDTVIHDFDKLQFLILTTNWIEDYRPIVLADFYFPATSIGSGLMWLPEACRGAVWTRWIADPAGHIKHNHGDQDFLTPLFWDALRWQEANPFAVVSYKGHINEKHAPQFFKRGFNDFNKIAVVCFHGFPRPWVAALTEAWIPQ